MGMFTDDEQSLIDDFSESSRIDAENSYNEQSAIDGSDGSPSTFIDDLFEGISLTDEGGSSSSGSSSGESIPSSRDDFSSGVTNYGLPSSNAASGNGITVTSTLGIAPGAKPDATWTDSFRTFLKDNSKDLMKLGFGLVQGMAAEDGRQKTVAAQAQSQIDQITLKDKLEQDKSKRIGASISGLAPVKKWGAKPLKRLDGSNVFQPTGLINAYGAK